MGDDRREADTGWGLGESSVVEGRGERETEQMGGGWWGGEDEWLRE